MNVFFCVRIVILQQYDATIAEQEAERTRLRAAVPRDQAALDVVDTNLRDVREEKRQFEIAAKAELDSNLEKWRALGEKREDSVVRFHAEHT